MLGRQQIAGIPTAINELFKNAHDAYASVVEIDFLRSDDLLLLRDDGIGMTRDDFESRWLTLGTESKLDSGQGLAPPKRPSEMATRPILGEKGIGRLAIAALGPQVLILTKPVAEPSVITAAFIHWGLFRVPGVDLDAIRIPVRNLNALPTVAEIAEMVHEVRVNLVEIAGLSLKDLSAEINAELLTFNHDIERVVKALRGPSLTNDGHGTQFFITPTERTLLPALDGSLRDGDASDLIRTLIGFTNTMIPGTKGPAIRPAFRDHKAPGVVEDIIAETEFFTAADFGNVDHRFEGRFDEFGQFRGSVSVYGEEVHDYVVPYLAQGVQTECGPFDIHFGVVQGNERESTVPGQQWQAIISKMNQIGGLYIYKEGVRILPYGKTNFDFLDIELNRTKSASYYYFSYRRMFGAIEINGRDNKNLEEKAGREGFRENTAYNQFRDILKSFFLRLAADFFREGAPGGEKFVERKAELDRIERAKRIRDKQVSVRRRAFKDQLDELFGRLEKNEPTSESATILRMFDRELSVAVSRTESDEVAKGLLAAESTARRRLESIRSEYRLVRPRGTALARQVMRDFAIYQQEYEQVVELTIVPALKNVEQRTRAVTEEFAVSLTKRSRFDSSINELAKIQRDDLYREVRSARALNSEITESVAKAIRGALGDAERALGSVLADAASLDLSELTDAQFVTARLEFEDGVQTAVNVHLEFIRKMQEALRKVPLVPIDSDEIAAEDLSESLEAEVLDLRERAEADLELAQLGMAIQVINHEFEASIKSVRRDLQELRVWGDLNERLAGVYQRLRSSFDHLDGYLSLFTPLQRRLYRQATTMTGAEIHRYVNDVFKERLDRHDIALQATKKFMQLELKGYPSTFYPVFINIVDNAIYWLSDQGSERRIQLDVEQGAMFIKNSGPAINPRDSDRIFELGYSKRPGGRGMGLSISRDVLRHEGYALNLESGAAGNVTFKIEKG